MRLPRRVEGLLDTDVQLLGSRAEPATVWVRERLRPREFLEAEQIAVEGPRLWLAAGWPNELDVIDGDDPHSRVSTTNGSSGGTAVPQVRLERYEGRTTRKHRFCTRPSRRVARRLTRGRA